MTSWSHGYVADSPYTFAYQAAVAPGGLAHVCAMMGVAWQPTPRLVMADIGCGRGYTVNALAAANPGWTMLGLDYNPAHIAEAASLAEQAELDNAIFVEADLAEMTDAEIDQLPELDVASLHGVWTWVSDAVRAGIVRLLARRLKPGGLVYIGYNALPAFGHDMALQRLFRHLAAQGGGSSQARAQAALPTIAELFKTKPANLPATALLKRLTEEGADPLDSAYLAHEFLTEHWRPVFFEDLLADLAPAKLDFVGSIALFENATDYLLGDEQRAIYDSMSGTAAHEFIKDVCLPRPFRRDVFIRGRRPCDPVAALDAQVVAACRVLPDEPPVLHVPVGTAEIPAALWGPIAAKLREGPQAMGQLRHLTPGRSPNSAELLTVLSGTGMVMPALRDSGPTAEATRFNRVVAANYAVEGRRGGQYAMASPVAAAGLPCTWLELAISAQPEVLHDEQPDLALLATRLLPDVPPDQAERVQATFAEILRERRAIWRGFGIL
jgi:SAM-dependent methyltransferase